MTAGLLLISLSAARDGVSAETVVEIQHHLSSRLGFECAGVESGVQFLPPNRYVANDRDRHCHHLEFLG